MDAVTGFGAGTNLWNNVFKTPTGTSATQPSGDFVPSGSSIYY